ncbi:putative solute carrier family 23 member 1-like [Apostichopus japonicus]|uniref:Putative solute carrier family 23 member 1-like n=1 Tax=Stichopus japonicus TaxID=307972 RepID=A0A2G8LFQ5_STIJA|nr:putative solute carrier family 23 member 1-like [Apostichopus japonicus]
MFLSNVSVPFPGSNGIRIFALFPMMLAIAIMWFVCVVLTLTGVFPDDPEVYGYAARVDTKVDNIRAAPWLALPYPGQDALFPPLSIFCSSSHIGPASPTILVSLFSCCLLQVVLGLPTFLFLLVPIPLLLLHDFLSPFS